MSRSDFSHSLQSSWYAESPLTNWLRPAAALFGAASAARRCAYARGWLQPHSLGAPVIVVGNITVGGTGKTPLVAWLAEYLAAQGRQPGVVSRGYGGQVGQGPHLVKISDSAELVGDEPLMLARQTGLPVCVGSDRVAAAKALVVAGASCIVSDDGLQHYRLQRDLEFAVLDAERMIGNGCLLPAGPLREPPARLTEVDLLFINGDTTPEQGVGFILQAEDLTSLGDGRRLPLAHFSGQRVWAVAGIGNPQRFYDSLRNAGIEPMPVEIPDHGRTDLQALSRESAQPILMTEKDAVKYQPESNIDAWYLPVRARLSPAALASLQEKLALLWPKQAADASLSSVVRGV